MSGSVATIGVGLVTIGVGLGIGRIGAAAMDGIARQPEAEAKIAKNMLIAAALIEGVGLLCAGLCFLIKGTGAA